MKLPNQVHEPPQQASGVGYPDQVAEPNLNPDKDPELEQAMMLLKKKYEKVFDYEIELKPIKENQPRLNSKMK